MRFTQTFAVALAVLQAACSGDGERASAEDGGDSAILDARGEGDGSGDAATDAASDSTGDVVGDRGDAGCTVEGRERDVWLWGSTVVTTPAERAAFFAFAEAHAVRTVYAESEGLLKSAPAALASFVEEAQRHCLAVELLFGRASWALTPGHAAAVALAKSSVAFSAGLPGPRPLGVHFDVEPYGLPEWKADENGTANQYLDLLEALRKELAGSGLRLVVDLPFWYDARNVTRGGVTRPMHEWVIDLVDVATLMDYRDHADPPDGIIDNASVEMTYAGTKTKKVVIGVETLCKLDPPVVTFCEEGAAAMDKALAATRTAYAGAPAFGGFAVHHYVSWKALGP